MAPIDLEAEPEVSPPPTLGAAVLLQFSECKRALQGIRKSSSSRCGFEQVAGERLVLEALRCLAQLPISRRILAETKIGCEVNHPFFRGHANEEIRISSATLKRKWKASIVQADVLASSQKRKSRSPAEGMPAGQRHKASSPLPRAQSPASSVRGSPCRNASSYDTGEITRAGGANSPSLNYGAMSVKELKAKICELGLDARQCVEKADLVALLADRAAGDPCTPPAQRRSFSSSSPGSSGFTRRLSRSRQSILRGSPSTPNTCSSSFARRLSARSRQSILRGSPATPIKSEPWSRSVVASREVQRILRARSDKEVLGLQGIVGSPEWPAAVAQRYRELCKVVHPDKCPASLALLSAEAFQKLEAAKERALKATKEFSPGGLKDKSVKSAKSHSSRKVRAQSKRGGC